MADLRERAVAALDDAFADKYPDAWYLDGERLIDYLDANPEAAATLAAYLRGASPQPKPDHGRWHADTIRRALRSDQPPSTGIPVSDTGKEPGPGHAAYEALRRFHSEGSMGWHCVPDFSQPSVSPKEPEPDAIGGLREVLANDIEALPDGVCDMTGGKHWDLVDRRSVLNIVRPPLAATTLDPGEAE